VAPESNEMPRCSPGLAMTRSSWLESYWREPTPENRGALCEFLKPEATKSQYLCGVKAFDADSQIIQEPSHQSPISSCNLRIAATGRSFIDGNAPCR
jgi:hypothetical protein